MTRSTNAPASRQRRKRIIKSAKGYFGSKHKLFRTAKEQTMRSAAYSFRDRKQKKRDFRKLWITRLNIACKQRTQLGLNYSKLVNLLKLSQIKINRKELSEMAIINPKQFDALLTKIQNPW